MDFWVVGGYDGCDQSCETKRGDNLNWRTWSAMGVLKGATAVFSCQEGVEDMGRWGEIGLSGWTLKVSSACVCMCV